jgi:hypothetical protein
MILFHKTDLILKFFDLVWKGFMTIDESINREILSRFENYNLTDDQVQLVYEILSGLTLAFIIYDDTSDSRGMVNDWLRSEKATNFRGRISNIRNRDGDISGIYFSDFTEICRKIFRNYIDDLRGDIRVVSDEMAREYNISRDSFMSFISNSISLRDLNPFI